MKLIPASNQVHESSPEKAQACPSLPPCTLAPIVSTNTLWGKSEALERLGGDEDLLRELCQIFLEESPKLLQKLRRAIAEADAETVMRAAHNLKGELGYLGAPGASQAARELEGMGHEKNLSQATEVFVRLEQEMTGLYLAIKDPRGATQ